MAQNSRQLTSTSDGENLDGTARYHCITSVDDAQRRLPGLRLTLIVNTQDDLPDNHEQILTELAPRLL